MDEDAKVPSKQAKKSDSKSVSSNQPSNGRGIRNKQEDMEQDDGVLDIKKIFMQHRQQEIEDFASEKIMERQGGLLQILNEPFCPPAMQYYHPKGAQQAKAKKHEEARNKRKEVFSFCQSQSKAVGKQNQHPNLQLSHLHEGPKYVEKQARPILKVKSTAEQYREENKTNDVLLSQDAMKEILAQLSELQELKKAFNELKVQSEQRQQQLVVPAEKEQPKESARSSSRSRRNDSKGIESSQDMSLKQSQGLELDNTLEESKDSRKHKKSKKSKREKSDKEETTEKEEKKNKKEKKSKSRNRLDAKDSNLSESLDKAPRSTSKGSLDKSGGLTEGTGIKKLGTFDPRDQNKPQSSVIKIGSAKTLKPTKTFTTPKDIFQQLNQHAHKKVIEEKPKVVQLAIDEQNEDIDSLYTEEFDD